MNDDDLPPRAGSGMNHATSATSEPAKTILDEAAEITAGDRQKFYGHPRDNHGCTAALWSAYLLRRVQSRLREMGEHPEDGRELEHILTLDARDVCWLNILQKASRDANLRKRDNLTDTAGYARNAEMVEEA